MDATAWQHRTGHGRTGLLSEELCRTAFTNSTIPQSFPMLCILFFFLYIVTLCRKKCAPTGLQIASRAGGHIWCGRIDPRSSNLPLTSSVAGHGVLCGRCIQFSRRPCGRRDRDRSGRVARRAAAGRERSERPAFGARPISRAPSVSGVRSGRASSPFSTVDVLDVLQPAREKCFAGAIARDVRRRRLLDRLPRVFVPGDLQRGRDHAIAGVVFAVVPLCAGVEHLPLG
ncbi:hypothetical protein HPB50_016546 [Hyalomma asiaticum]|uniref:Uncharacterized protein n=1 Tax=Hyalomma asiaticum TaxID=266040 RepID=A0ACB7SVJ3_HYAAI|nr:hypothetical protein HPB50_016546 [Hyalomma asiaticum]